MKSILLGVLGLLALSLVPISGHAQMPGDKCGGDDQVQIGTTRMASDQQNIIACLKTGDTTPGANVSEWKAMTSSGGGNRYSLTCTDWKESGFRDKDDCIQDGRWHLVYASSSTGTPLFGSLAELRKYTDQGADVKNTDYDNSAQHICVLALWRDGVLHCIGSSRIQGEPWRNDLKQNDGLVGLGGGDRRSDGVRISANVNPLSDGSLRMTAFPTYAGMPFKWYVKF